MDNCIPIKTFLRGVIIYLFHKSSRELGKPSKDKDMNKQPYPLDSWLFEDNDLFLKIMPGLADFGLYERRRAQFR